MTESVREGGSTVKFTDHFKSQARLLYEAGVIDQIDYIVMRSDGRFSKAVVTSAVIAVTFYALVIFQFAYLNIQNHTSVFPPLEFTTGYFAFWTVEIVMLASIKKHNIKNKHERDDPTGDIIYKIQSRFSPGGLKTAEPEVMEGFEDEIQSDAQ